MQNLSIPELYLFKQLLIEDNTRFLKEKTPIETEDVWNKYILEKRIELVNKIDNIILDLRKKERVKRTNTYVDVESMYAAVSEDIKNLINNRGYGL